MASRQTNTKKKWLKLENLTFIAALLGVVVGITAPTISNQVSFLGDIFLTLLKMTIIPLIFVSVFVAVAKQAGSGLLKKIGGRTLLYFLGTSTVACITGLAAATLLPEASSSALSFAGYDASKLGSISFRDVIMSFFATNPFKALANGEIIQIVVFSMAMGLASVRLDAKKRDLLVGVADAGHDLTMIMIQGILVVAPIGVFALVASVIAKTDMASFSGLGWFFAATTLAALTHSLITLPLFGYIFGRFNPYRFMWNVKEALLMALATASSSATLPVSTRVLEEREGVSPKTTGFVLPLGATLNMDGSALYQALVVLFLGSIAGMHFSFAQQFMVFVFVLLSSSGTAGIPSGGMVMMGATLQMLGIPLELIGIYLLVDRFWDPVITAINVQGDLFGTKIIDRMLAANAPIEAVPESEGKYYVKPPAGSEAVNSEHVL